MKKTVNVKFDQRASKYDNGFEGKFSERFYRNLVDMVDVSNGAKVLDVGCGTGTILYRLSKKKKIQGYGIDVEPAMIKEAQKKLPDMKIQTGNCNALPFDDQSMDAITVCMAYHHFEDRGAFRKEVSRILKYGGVLYISDPRFPWIVRKIFDLITFLTGLNAKFYKNTELAAEFEQSGFYVVSNKKDIFVQTLSFRKDK